MPRFMTRFVPETVKSVLSQPLHTETIPHKIAVGFLDPMTNKKFNFFRHDRRAFNFPPNEQM
jgi:hypothetical protein